MLVPTSCVLIPKQSSAEDAPESLRGVRRNAVDDSLGLSVLRGKRFNLTKRKPMKIMLSVASTLYTVGF